MFAHLLPFDFEKLMNQENKNTTTTTTTTFILIYRFKHRYIGASQTFFFNTQKSFLNSSKRNSISKSFLYLTFLMDLTSCIEKKVKSFVYVVADCQDLSLLVF